MGYIIQFQLIFNCMLNKYTNDEYPIELQYSLDYGENWQLVVGTELDADGVSQEMMSPSVYYMDNTWNIYTIPLPDAISTR